MPVFYDFSFFHYNRHSVCSSVNTLGSSLCVLDRFSISSHHPPKLIRLPTLPHLVFIIHLCHRVPPHSNIVIRVNLLLVSRVVFRFLYSIRIPHNPYPLFHTHCQSKSSGDYCELVRLPAQRKFSHFFGILRHTSFCR